MPEMTLEDLTGLIKEQVATAVKSHLDAASTNAPAKTVEEAVNKAADPAPKAYAQPKDPNEKGLRAARLVRALAAGRGNLELAAKHAANKLHDETVAKALAAGDGTAGGFLVPEQFSSEIIELLRPMAKVRSMNPVVLPMPGGNMTMPRLAGGASASYIGENTNIPKTEPNFGQLSLSAKKLAALVPMSNDLIRYSSPQADAVVRDDLVSAMAQAEDLNFIRSDGTGAAPKGLRYWAAAGQINLANATVNQQNVTDDLGSLPLQLELANSRMIRPGYLINPRTKRYLFDFVNANGHYVWRDEMRGGTLNGYPYAVSNQIPQNLDATGNATNDETEIYFVDFADVVIGDVHEIILDVSSEAAYHDGSQVQASFSLDQTVVRAIARHDLVVRHTSSIAILTGVDWGA